MEIVAAVEKCRAGLQTLRQHFCFAPCRPGSPDSRERARGQRTNRSGSEQRMGSELRSSRRMRGKGERKGRFLTRLMSIIFHVQPRSSRTDRESEVRDRRNAGGGALLLRQVKIGHKEGPLFARRGRER